jgi:hypothetical protein
MLRAAVPDAWPTGASSRGIAWLLQWCRPGDETLEVREGGLLLGDQVLQ